MSSSARLIGKLAATARSQNPFTSAASGSPRKPALASHAFNALMSSSAIMFIPDIGPRPRSLLTENAKAAARTPVRR